MNISEVCIRRPCSRRLMTASLIVFGAFGYRLLPVAALPAVDFPTISITATLPGASPETMAASVASPIERQLSTIAGISSMTSSSSLGTTSITVQFDLNRDIDGAALDVQTALTVARNGDLPIEMTTPPSFRKVNPGDFPVLYHQPELGDAAAVDGRRVRPRPCWRSRFRSCRGVAQVLVYGGAEIRRAGPGRSGRGGGAQHLARRHPHRRRQDQFQRAGRHASTGERQNSDAAATGAMQQGRGLPQRRRGLSQRRAGQARRGRARHRLRRERPASPAGSTTPAPSCSAIQRQPDANTVAVVDCVHGTRCRRIARRSRRPSTWTCSIDRSISVRESGPRRAGNAGDRHRAS